MKQDRRIESLRRKKTMKKKRIITALSILVALIAVVGVFLVMKLGDDNFKKKANNEEVTQENSSKEESDKSKDKEKTTLKISAVTGTGVGHEVFVLDENSYEPITVSGTSCTLIVENEDDEIEAVELMVACGGKLVRSEKLDITNKEQKIDLTELENGIYNLSVKIKKDGKYLYYVSSEEGFLQAVSDGDLADAKLFMLQDISVKDRDVTIRKPFTWDTCGCKMSIEKKLLFVSEEDIQKNSKMVIINEAEEDIRASQVWAMTPGWSYEIKVPFQSFKEEKYYYINATKVNDKEIDTSLMYVDTREKLGKYLKDNTVVLPESVKTLELAGEVSSKRQNGTKIDFDMPHVAVIWNGKNAVDREYATQYMNVLSYNDEKLDENIGGAGTSKILSGKLVDADGNSTKLKIDGNYIRATSGYITPLDITTSKPKVDLSNGGKCELIIMDGQHYLRVSDENNQTRGYKLDVKTKEYKLPIIHVTTDDGSDITSKDNYKTGRFSIDYNGNGQYQSINKAQMKIRGRGHSSWDLAKKPYKIKFTSKTSLFGLTESKEWVLLANHGDRSLMRNTLAMTMGRVLDEMVFVPHSYLVDVFINGEYQGVYSLSEQIEIKDGRIPGERKSTEVDTDYLVELSGDEEKTSFGHNAFQTPLQQYVTVREPDAEILKKEQKDYVKSYITKVDKSIKNLDGYEEYIDIPSLIDWFLLNEFSYNLDGTFRRSNFLLKAKGDKLYYASPWDFDYAFGNFWRDSSKYREWICLGNANTDGYINTNWMHYLLEDENFTSKLKDRWDEVGEQLYRTALDTIDKNEKLIKVSAEENFNVWTNCFDRKIQYESNKTVGISTYEGQVDYLRTFIKNRYKWMDETIKGL